MVEIRQFNNVSDHTIYYVFRYIYILKIFLNLNRYLNLNGRSHFVVHKSRKYFRFFKLVKLRVFCSPEVKPKIGLEN